jgi:hypothetical protein
MVKNAVAHFIYPLPEIGSTVVPASATFFRLRSFVKHCPDFRAAGVLLVLMQEGPAIFAAAAHRKTAGETPAPQRQFDIWNWAHIMPHDFLK